jgi:hypothetical protein
VDDDRGMKRRDHLRGPQRIGHHGAAAGPELDETHVLGLAHQPPHGSGPQPDQLAEHLAHLRRGDEIAVAAERIARRVIAALGMREAERHELPHRHRPGERDAVANVGFERRVVHRSGLV